MNTLTKQEQKQALCNHLISIGINDKYEIIDMPKDKFLLVNKGGNFLHSKKMNYNEFNHYLFGFDACKKHMLKC